MSTTAVSGMSSRVTASCVMRVGASGQTTVWMSGAMQGAAATSVADGSRATTLAPSRVNAGWLVSPATAAYVRTRGEPATGSGAVTLAACAIPGPTAVTIPTATAAASSFRNEPLRLSVCWTLRARQAGQQVPGNQLGHDLRLLDRRQVRGVDELQARAGDAGHDPLAVLGRRRRVVAARDDERRRADGAELGDEVHVLDRRAAGGVALVRRGGEHGAHGRGGGGLALDEARRQPAPDARIGDRVDALGTHGRCAVGPHRGRPEVRRRAAEHEPADALGRVDGHPMPTIPPSDNPHQCARSTPSRSSRRRASAPRSASS